MAVKTECTDVVEYDNIPNYIYINNDGAHLKLLFKVITV